MKVNIIVPFTSLTGGIRVIFLYANYLAESGKDVCVYVPMISYKFNHNILSRIKLSLGNTLKRGTKVDWFDCKFKVKLVPSIKDIYLRNADVTIATAWPTAVDVSNLSVEKGKKVYFIQDYEIWSGKVEDVDKTLKLPLNKIVITKDLKEMLKNKFNVDSTIIYNGLDDDEFLKEDKVINDKKTILMLYNEAPNKGTYEGIEVLKYIKDKYNIRVIMFGYRRGNMVPKEFEFYENPSRQDLMRLYKESDIYIFPSKHEAWGLPVMEAMANKCAVVGNRVGCLKEIATDNHNALIVDNCNYDDMKIKVEKLLNDEEVLKKIQLNGYELSKRFKWTKSFEKFECFLKKLK